MKFILERASSFAPDDEAPTVNPSAHYRISSEPVTIERYRGAPVTLMKPHIHIPCLKSLEALIKAEGPIIIDPGKNCPVLTIYDDRIE